MADRLGLDLRTIDSDDEPNLLDVIGEVNASHNRQTIVNLQHLVQGVNPSERNRATGPGSTTIHRRYVSTPPRARGSPLATARHMSSSALRAPTPLNELVEPSYPHVPPTEHLQYTFQRSRASDNQPRHDRQTVHQSYLMIFMPYPHGHLFGPRTKPLLRRLWKGANSESWSRLVSHLVAVGSGTKHIPLMALLVPSFPMISSSLYKKFHPTVLIALVYASLTVSAHGMDYPARIMLPKKHF